jgi:hypothetical protein
MEQPKGGGFPLGLEDWREGEVNSKKQKETGGHSFWWGMTANFVISKISSLVGGRQR